MNGTKPVFSKRRRNGTKSAVRLAAAAAWNMMKPAFSKRGRNGTERKVRLAAAAGNMTETENRSGRAATEHPARNTCAFTEGGNRYADTRRSQGASAAR